MSSESLNIISVTDLISPDEPGGSGRAAWEISRALSRLGHHVTIITKGNKQRNDRDSEVIDGITIYRHFLSPMRLAVLSASVGKTIKADAMIFHSPLTSWFFINKAKKIPAVMFNYSPWHTEYEIRCGDLKRSRLRRIFGSSLRKKIEYSVLKSARKVFTTSRFMSKLLMENHGIKSDVVHLGVDASGFYPARDKKSKEMLRESLGIKKEAFVIFTVRNLVSRMGLENLIIAFGDLLKLKNLPPLQLVIGGSGYLKTALQELAFRTAPVKDAVIFTGYISDDKLPDYYRAADLFVLPTRLLEGFGLVTLEALSSGLPVLATPVGANEEILEPLGKEFLFKNASAEAIFEGIRDFILYSYKKTDDDALSFKCRDYVLKNFSWEDCARKIEKTLLLLI